jgi:hypothetical protein
LLDETRQKPKKTAGFSFAASETGHSIGCKSARPAIALATAAQLEMWI